MNEKVWSYFHNLYGGGPICVRRKKLFSNQFKLQVYRMTLIFKIFFFLLAIIDLYAPNPSLSTDNLRYENSYQKYRMS